MERAIEHTKNRMASLRNQVAVVGRAQKKHLDEAADLGREIDDLNRELADFEAALDAMIAATLPPPAEVA